jgi:hypothetical protein
MNNGARGTERGQILVIVAVGFIVMVALVGLVVDGGYAWGKQRETQNAADSAAEAGAVVIMENLAGTVPAKTDADVSSALLASASSNGVAVANAFYTDIDGRLLDPTGGIAANDASAARVGAGTIPPGTSGVKAIGEQTFDTFLARVIGFSQFTASAPAIAVAGYAGGTCDAEAGCVILPITVPVTVLGCDGSNNPAPVVPATKWPAPSSVLSVPLCKNGPGNVGWLDWTPTAGGTSELEQAILTPSNPALEWPQWYYITSTGNVNSKPIEDALRTYDGQVVQVPQFDGTCDAAPTGPGLADCPDGHVGGNGSNQWYHIAGMSAFQFCATSVAGCSTAGFDHGAYVNGSNPICDTGNGATSCLAGKFKTISYKGRVTAAPGPNTSSSNLTVALIK